MLATVKITIFLTGLLQYGASGARNTHIDSADGARNTVKFTKNALKMTSKQVSLSTQEVKTLQSDNGM